MLGASGLAGNKQQQPACLHARSPRDCNLLPTPLADPWDPPPPPLCPLRPRPLPLPPARSVRDGAMVELGVRLEDKADGSSVWKLEDPAVLAAERRDRAAAAAEAAAKMLRAGLEARRRDLEKYEKLAALPAPAAALADKYSAFDGATGEPTHDAAGAALECKALEKARKELEKQLKVWWGVARAGGEGCMEERICGAGVGLVAGGAGLSADYCIRPLPLPLPLPSLARCAPL